MAMRGYPCLESSPAMEINGSDEPKAAGERGLKLFGVRILGKRGFGEEEEVLRKSASMGDLVSCDAGAGAVDVELGYLSDGGLVGGSRRKRGCQERKRGIPWTEEEHKTFLAGLKTLGKGDWRGISRNFVPTRTPTQVASHAQKYFLRQSNPNKKKRRSSLFDVVIDETAIAGEIDPTLSLKNTHEAIQVADHLCKDIHMVGTPSFNTIQSVKESEALPPTIDHVKAPTNVNLMAEILGSTKEQAILSLFDIPEEFHTNSTSRVPDFLKLSLTPHPHRLAKVSAASAFIESSDLSLSIGPPCPRNLGEFSSGAIHVI